MSDLPETFVPGFHDENKVRKMPYATFGKTGLKVSRLSLGGGTFSYFYGKTSLEECKQIVLEAIKSGINYIDTAPWYGHGESEDILGKCLEGVPRKAYYLATKVCRYEKDIKKMFDFSAEKTLQSIDLSLKRLKLDYVDVLQIHDIEFAPSLDVVLNETLPAVDKIRKSGKARFIGVTGYPVGLLAECVEKSSIEIDMVLSYCRLSLIDNSLNKYLPVFQSHNLGIINAASHALGLLTSVGPQAWHPATAEIKAVCAEAREYSKANNVELAKLALYYASQQPGPHTSLVGVTKREMLISNLDVFFNGLNKHELEVLNFIQNTIFSKLTSGHWENVELDGYWKEMKGEKSNFFKS